MFNLVDLYIYMYEIYNLCIQLLQVLFNLLVPEKYPYNLTLPYLNFNVEDDTLKCSFCELSTYLFNYNVCIPLFQVLLNLSETDMIKVDSTPEEPN